jgi:mandelamide amidase
LFFYPRAHVEDHLLIDVVIVQVRAAGCRLIEIDFDRDVRGLVGTFDDPTPAAVIAEVGLTPPVSSRDTMARWLLAHAPQVSPEMLYQGRPMVDEPPSVLPPSDRQVTILNAAMRRYDSLFRRYRVSAIAFPTVPILAPAIREGGPKEPFGEAIALNGQSVEEGRVLMRNLFIAPRLGAAALSLPVGVARGLPVGMELLARPGDDGPLLGLGMAVERVLGRIPPPALSR